MQETIPKITLPCGFVFAANHSGTITPAQVERIKLNKLDVTNYHLGWKGMFLLGYSLAYYITAFTHLFEDRWHGRGNIVFPVLIGMSLIIFLIVLTKELTEIWEGIKCKLWAFQDIRSRAIKTAEGSLAISLRNTPVIQIGGRVLHLLPYPPNSFISPLDANLEIVAGKKYRVHYLEKSGLALSAEELGLEETESIETYQLAFAGKYSFSELAKNRLGIFTGSQKIRLMSGITGSLLAMLLILIMAILMAPVLSAAVGYAIPNTLPYLIYWFFLHVFPLGVVVFFIAAVGKKPLLVVADILVNKIRIHSGLLIKPFDVSEKELSQPSFKPRIEIAGKMMKTSAVVYRVLQEGHVYTGYSTFFSKYLLSIEALPNPGQNGN